MKSIIYSYIYLKALYFTYDCVLYPGHHGQGRGEIWEYQDRSWETEVHDDTIDTIGNTVADEHEIVHWEYSLTYLTL